MVQEHSIKTLLMVRLNNGEELSTIRYKSLYREDDTHPLAPDANRGVVRENGFESAALRKPGINVAMVLFDIR